MKPDDPQAAADEAVVEALLAKVPWPEGDPELDDETLAAWVEGALSEAEQAAVEARLAQWPEGRAWMAQVRDSREAWAPPAAKEAPPPSVMKQTAWMPLAAAALLLIAFGIAHFLGGFARSQRTLEQQIAKLKSDHADLFGDFDLLDAKYLAGRREVERGGLVAGFPHHTEFFDRPTFSWQQRDGIEVFRVTLYDSEGRMLWQRTTRGTELVYPEDEPALEPGASYVWEVSGDAGLGVQTSRRSFDVISSAARERLKKAEDATKPLGDLQGLVMGHYAIRMDLLRYAERWLENTPADERVETALAYVRGQ